jgi:hypothetical protein
MKLLLGFLAAVILVVLGTTVDARALTYYVGNNTGVTTTATVVTSTCGNITVTVPAGTIVPVVFPVGCTVTGVIYRSGFYPATGMTYGLPMPTPPTNLIVTIARAVFLN